MQRWGLKVLRRPCVPMRPPGNASPLRPSKRWDAASAASAPPAQLRGLGMSWPLGHQHRGDTRQGRSWGRGSPDASPLPASHGVASAALDRRLQAFCLSPRLCSGPGSPQPQPAVKPPPPGSGSALPAPGSCVALCLQCASRGPSLRPLTSPQSSSLPGPDPLSCLLSAGSPWTPRPSWR